MIVVDMRQTPDTPSTVSDVGDEYDLVNTRRDIEFFLNSIDTNMGIEDNHSLFVKTDSGAIEEVLAFRGRVPYDQKRIVRLK